MGPVGSAAKGLLTTVLPWGLLSGEAETEPLCDRPRANWCAAALSAAAPVEGFVGEEGTAAA